MVHIETLGDKKPEETAPASAAREKSRAAKSRRKRARFIQRATAATPKPVPEERLSIEEWTERFKAEEEARARAEIEAKAAAADENRRMTKEEFLAMQQAKMASMPAHPQPASPAAQQKPPQRRSSILDRLAANADSALGVIPKAQVAGAQVAPRQAPAAAYANSGLQEIGRASGGGPVGIMRSNPVMAGAVAFIGLLIVLIGTYLHGSLYTALIIEVLGFGLFIFGIVFVFGYIGTMKRQKKGM